MVSETVSEVFGVMFFGIPAHHVLKLPLHVWGAMENQTASIT